MAFNYTHMESDGAPVLFIEMPMIKDLTFHMDYNSKFMLIPSGGKLTVEVKESYAIASIKLKSTQHGVLYPELHDVYVDFGNS